MKDIDFKIWDKKEKKFIVLDELQKNHLLTEYAVKKEA